MKNFSNRLIFGCCNLSENKTKNKALKILNYARNLGFKFYDTAPLYSKGYSELLIGEAFKNKQDIKVITKVGNYPIPKTYVPAKFALPLNTLKNNLRFSYFKKTKKFSLRGNKNFFDKENFINHVKSSRQKLKNCIIESILFHELNPFILNINLLEELNIYLNKFNISKLGYAGKFHKELPDINIPNCIKIMQLEIPIGLNEIDEKEVFKLIDKNQDKEFRFYNIFQEKSLINQRMLGAKKILNDFPNTKIIFQTTSFKHLKSNFLFFVS